MPRKPRVDIAGFHHVLNRGVNRENIFLCDEDKREFLRILNDTRLVYDLIVHAFSLEKDFHHTDKTLISHLSFQGGRAESHVEQGAV